VIAIPAFSEKVKKTTKITGTPTPSYLSLSPSPAGNAATKWGNHPASQAIGAVRRNARAPLPVSNLRLSSQLNAMQCSLSFAPNKIK